jgi:SAM-dependent methyltransferase
MPCVSTFAEDDRSESQPFRYMSTGIPVKRLVDGRALLNLACGTRMHQGWNNVDFSPYARVARRPALAWLLGASGFLSEERKQRLAAVDPQIIAWDLRRGIPFPPETFDGVYHSHFLEHIESSCALGLLRQCHTVLKRGGILRVVVPDLELLVNDYTRAVDRLKKHSDASLEQHQLAVAGLFDQMVRRDSTGTTQQTSRVRYVERLIRGNAADTGELHRWMYDEFSLRDLLGKAGFRKVQRHTATSSGIAGWPEFYLDNNKDGSAYKPESLYMEGIR